MTADAILHVAVGVIRNSNNQVLLSRRAMNVDHANLWEFPGGKLEPGETVVEALSRELNEELGLTINSARPLIKIYHDYKTYSVLLDVWQIDSWRSDLIEIEDGLGREGQKIKWISVAKLSKCEFPQANEPIIKAVQLPDFYLICPQPEGDDREYIKTFKECISAGVRLFQLRFENESEYVTHEHLVAELLELCRENNCSLLLNSSPEYALKAGVHGVHLNSSRLMRIKQRPLDKNLLVAASCHNADELEHASKIQADFAVLSPVKQTASHPRTKPLGWNEFEKNVAPVTIPVYALGGMQYADLNISLEHGGQGISVLGGVWKSKDVKKTLKNYITYQYL